MKSIHIKEQKAFIDSIHLDCPKQIAVNAGPGSGKTHAIVLAANKIKSFASNSKVLITAYNGFIVDSLRKRIGNKQININTIHSIAFSILKKAKPYGFEISELKYKNYLSILDKGKDEKIPYNLINYVFNLMKENLVDSSQYICLKYNINLNDIDYNELDIIFQKIYNKPFKIQNGKYFNGFVIKKGDYIKINFTDQIYLTFIKDLIPENEKYDYIIIDEAQDLTPLKLAFLRAMGKKDCVFIFLGDRNQTINQYAGSDSTIFETICNESMYFEFFITLRCPKKVVEFVNAIHPTKKIKAHKSNIEGSVERYNIKDAIQFIIQSNQSIYIMSPTNELLFDIYLTLIKKDIVPRLKGFEVKDYIINLLKRSKSITDLKININKILGFIYKELKSEYPNLTLYGIQSHALYKAHNEPISIMISLLFHYFKIDLSNNDLSNDIKMKDILNKFYIIFSDSIERNVTLLSCHKSKGMEAENVILINSEGLITPKDIQTTNLSFVALTRSLNRLILVNPFEVADLNI